MNELDELKQKFIALQEKAKDKNMEYDYEEKGIRCIPCEKKQAEIDCLKAENAARKYENDRLKKKVEFYEKLVDKHLAEIEDSKMRRIKASIHLLNESRKQLSEIAHLSAENAKYKEALTAIEKMRTGFWTIDNLAMCIEGMRQLAREATNEANAAYQST
jgi:hypothetical protein